MITTPNLFFILRVSRLYTGRDSGTVQSLRKRTAAEYFGNQCFVCSKKFGKNFAFHHIRYLQGEKTYADFKNSIDYNRYLCGRIKEHPQDFALLCNRHHTAVEKLKRYRRDRFGRLLLMVVLSR